MYQGDKTHMDHMVMKLWSNAQAQLRYSASEKNPKTNQMQTITDIVEIS